MSNVQNADRVISNSDFQRSSQAWLKTNAKIDLPEISSVAGFIFIMLHRQLATRYAFNALNRRAERISSRRIMGKSVMTNFSTYGPQASGSATIYQFPVGGRAGLASSHDRSRRSDEIGLPDDSEYVLTDAWYHQEAIHQATVNRLTKQ